MGDPIASSIRAKSDSTTGKLYPFMEVPVWLGGLAFEIGQFYGGINLQLDLEPTWNLSRNLEFGATYQFNRVRFPDRDQEFFVHLARIRTQINFSSAMSISSFVQYNTGADLLSANVRFRYNVREGNDLWLVYNEGRIYRSIWKYARTPPP